MADQNQQPEPSNLSLVNRSADNHENGIDARQPKPVAGKQNKGKAQQRPKKLPQQGRPTTGGLRAPELGLKGMGFVKVVKDNFGFIGSPDLDEQLFFHGTEVIKPEDFKGSAVSYFKEHFAAGDEVEFVVGEGQRSNVVSLQVRKLPLNSVKAQLLSEERFTGVVSTELGAGQWRSEESSSGRITYSRLAADGEPQGDAQIEFFVEDVHKLRRALKRHTIVEFSICTDNQTKARKAVHIDLKGVARSKKPDTARAGTADGGEVHPASPTLLHGFIKAVKANSGGSIRCVEQQRRYSFKMANVPAQHQDKLEVGSEVLFNIMTDARGNETVISLAILPPGSLPEKQTSSSLQPGRVVRPYSETGPVDGLILTECQSQIRFRPGSLEGSDEDASSLKTEDEVEFVIEDDLKADKRYAASLRLVARAEQKRELGKVRTLKSNFGFISCCQRSGQIFFHFSSLDGCKPGDIQKNDDVEFSVAKDTEHGTVAIGVRKMPPGSAVFETISEETYEGVIHTPMYNISPLVLSSGVLTYDVDATQSKLLFAEKDFKESVQAGDLVSFQIADNLKAAKQAEKLGSTVSHLVGKRATNGRRLRLSGTVKSSNGSSGFLRYTAKGDIEKRVYFHLNDVTEKLELRPGDEVAFNLAINQKTKELAARNIVRTKEAKGAQASELTPTSVQNSERRIATIKQSSNHANLPAPRPTPAMPDGTRGFALGRGSALPHPPAGTSGASATRAPGKLLDSPPGMNGMSNGQQTSVPGSKDASAQASEGVSEPSKFGDPLEVPLKLAKRTSSGRALNPAAADFTPQSLQRTSDLPPEGQAADS